MGIRGFFIGKIHKTAPPGVEQCTDTMFTDSFMRGRCSKHGGLLFKKSRAKKEREELVLQDEQPDVKKIQFIRPQQSIKEVAILPDIEAEPEPTNYYIVNSDGKVELHFEYSTYKNLPTKQQGTVKRFFNWSRNRGAWVSKAKYGDYMVLEIIKMLNLPLKGIDQRKTFAESLDAKVERAENRADIYENRAAKREKEAQALQSEFNRLRKDWSWLTQPYVNTSGGRRFRNHKEKVLARYDKGFELYQQADKYAERAAIAKESANIDQYKDLAFVMRRIKETKKSIKGRYSSTEYYQKLLNRIKSGETIKKYSGEEYKEQEILADYQIALQNLDFEQSKLIFLEAKREDFINVNPDKYFTKENMFGVKFVRDRFGWHKVFKLNPTTVRHTTSENVVYNDQRFFVKNTPYAEIKDISFDENFKMGRMEWVKIDPQIGMIFYQTNPELYTQHLENTALATAISLLGSPKWKNLYYRILAKSQNNELALYIIYHLYNRRQMTNIPANYQSQVQNFVFTYNL